MSNLKITLSNDEVFTVNFSYTKEALLANVQNLVNSEVWYLKVPYAGGTRVIPMRAVIALDVLD